MLCHSNNNSSISHSNGVPLSALAPLDCSYRLFYLLSLAEACQTLCNHGNTIFRCLPSLSFQLLLLLLLSVQLLLPGS